jgi:hypothetical protein
MSDGATQQSVIFNFFQVILQSKADQSWIKIRPLTKELPSTSNLHCSTSCKEKHDRISLRTVESNLFEQNLNP